MARQSEMKGVGAPKTKSQLRAEDLAESQDVLEVKREETKKREQDLVHEVKILDSDGSKRTYIREELEKIKRRMN